MACLAAPAAAALVANVLKKKIPEKYHIEWLNLMLWGGFIMLLVDHIKNGEIVWYFPFFTRNISQIWREVISTGIPMTLSVAGLWMILVVLANIKANRLPQQSTN